MTGERDDFKYQAHPWHGLDPGEDLPEKLKVYIELVPSDGIKYELDKKSGILRVDRPQRFSSYAPAPYGMVPRTYCGEKTASIMEQDLDDARKIAGDKDPLDIMVLTEKIIPHGEIMLTARPVGGIALLDKGEADDKIIAVLEDDAVYGSYRDMEELPEGILSRIEHYFLSYKAYPDSEDPVCRVLSLYDRERAHQVIRASREDYQKKFVDKISGI